MQMKGEKRVSDSKAVRGPREERERGRDADKRTSLPTFYRQVVAELRKVVWPTQEQLITYFLVVMAFVLVMIAIVSVLDLGFGKLVFWMFGGGGTQ
jgi:preprotein translocase subunit SecE